VDTTPNCGNMLAAVAPFAIERGLVAIRGDTTPVRMFNVNTGKVVEACVSTPDGAVSYEGDTRIDGVPGTGSAIALTFVDPAGARTGRLLPTGNPVDCIDGVPVSCVDFAVPVVLIDAGSLAKTGYETRRELDEDHALLARLERIRRVAGELMGQNDVPTSVLPKIALLAAPRGGGSITSRFFVPWSCHVAHSATGALCIAAACLVPGTVAAQIAALPPGRSASIGVEHPSGRLQVRIESMPQEGTRLHRIINAGVVLTARPLFDGVAPVRRDSTETIT
jgi:4-oxalomesaconate tautomerase